ncbi:MAG: ERF family protein [Hyphomicrobiales bacterium]|nr:ERF family protein [Hyphomicrobiales bacterium]
MSEVIEQDDTQTIEAEFGPTPSQAVAKVSESVALAPHALPPSPYVAMLDRALANGASIEVLEKFMALQERFEQNEARKAFNMAIARARAEIPPIRKNRRVGFDSKKAGAARTDYAHEDLAEIDRTVMPILGKYGLSYRFNTHAVPNEPVTVTCIISHELGYSEQNTLSAGRDDSGNKNSIQAIGSTVTYLQRYTLKAALGLSAAEDDDGAVADSPSKGTISDKQVEILQKLIIKTKSNIGKFCQAMKVECLPDITLAQWDAVVNAMKTKAAQVGVTLTAEDLGETETKS